MTAIVIVNIVFSAFVVIGILGLMAWGIVSDRITVASLRAHHRRRQEIRERARARSQRSTVGGVARGAV